MNVSTTLPPTIDQPVLSDEDILYEVVDGRRVELPPMSAYEVQITTLLVAYLAPYTKTHGLGRTVGEMLFALEPEEKLQQRPDVAFVSYERWPKDRRVPRTNAWEVRPDLAIEVVSPTNFAEEVVERVHKYFRHDVKEVWVVYPTVEHIYMYSSPASIRVWTRSEELHGSKVLPELRMPLAVVFEEENTTNS